MAQIEQVDLSLLDKHVLTFALLNQDMAYIAFENSVDPEEAIRSGSTLFVI